MDSESSTTTYLSLTRALHQRNEGPSPKCTTNSARPYGSERFTAFAHTGLPNISLCVTSTTSKWQAAKAVADLLKLTAQAHFTHTQPYHLQPFLYTLWVHFIGLMMRYNELRIFVVFVCDQRRSLARVRDQRVTNRWPTKSHMKLNKIQILCSMFTALLHVSYLDMIFKQMQLSLCALIFTLLGRRPRPERLA